MKRTIMKHKWYTHHKYDDKALPNVKKIWDVTGLNGNPVTVEPEFNTGSCYIEEDITESKGKEGEHSSDKLSDFPAAGSSCKC